ICVSPETQARVVQPGRHAKTLEDFFGWNLTAERYAGPQAISINPAYPNPLFQRDTLEHHPAQHLAGSSKHLDNFYSRKRLPSLRSVHLEPLPPRNIACSVKQRQFAVLHLL